MQPEFLESDHDSDERGVGRVPEAAAGRTRDAESIREEEGELGPHLLVKECSQLFSVQVAVRCFVEYAKGIRNDEDRIAPRGLLGHLDRRYSGFERRAKKYEVSLWIGLHYRKRFEADPDENVDGDRIQDQVTGGQDVIVA